MKRLFVLFAVGLMLFSLSFSVFADERKGEELEIKLFAQVGDRYYFADVADEISDDIRVGENLNLAFSDFKEFTSIIGNDVKLGLMLVDDENGNGFVTYHVSDVVVKGSDGSNYTISTEGTFSGNLESGIYEDDTAIIHYFDMSDKSDIMSNINHIQQVSLSVNYISYDDHGVSTAESGTEEIEVPDTVPNPNTGVTVGLIAPIVATAVIAAYKKK